MTIMPVRPVLPVASVAFPRSLLGALGRPPGILADVGGILTPSADDLQRAGWIVHMTAEDQALIRRAARLGVRTALKAGVHDLPLMDRHYDGIVLTLPDLVEVRSALSEVQRIARAGATVLVLVAMCETATALSTAVASAGMTQVVLHTVDGSSLAHTAPPGTPLVAAARCG